MMHPIAMRFRSGVKLLISAALFYSGLLDLYLRLRHARRGVVLLYHRVLTAPEWASSYSSDAIVVTPGTFRRHLRFLRRRFTLVNPDEFESWRRGGITLAKPPCLISFDDGWKDNLTNALPILRDERVPAVIFLPTDYIGTGRLFWQERFSQMLDRLGAMPEFREHALVARHGLGEVFTPDSSRRTDRARDVARSFKRRTPEEISALLADISALIGSATGSTPPSTVDGYLSWEDIQAMRPHNIHYGSHTVSHRILTQLDRDAALDELTTSKTVLEQKLRQPMRLLAYPNGDHDRQTAELARESGYGLAFTTIPGWIDTDSDPHRLPRLNVHERAHRHTPVFYASMLGLF